MTCADLEALQVESLDEALLEGRQGGVGDNGEGGAARTRIKQGHLLDLGQGVENFYDAQRDSLVGQGAAKQGAEEQSQNTIESMDANLLIGPVMEGPPTDKVRVLHSFEGLLDVMLTAIGAHDVFIAPGVLVGEEEVFAEEGPLQVMPSALPNVIVEA